MKTAKLLVMVLMVFMTIFSALGGLTPQPIVGKIQVEGYPDPEGLMVRQTNLRTTFEYDVPADATGFYLVEWSNLEYQNGDKIKITILVCAELPECSKTVTISEGVPLFVDFTALSTQAVEAIAKDTYYVCWDKSVVTDPLQCPSPPEKVVEKTVVKEVVEAAYVCQDGTVVDDKNACLETKEQVKAYALGAGVIVLAGFAGLVAYYIKKKKRSQAEKMLKTYVKKSKKK